MKKVGFIGTYDKTDLILNIAKILTTMKKKSNCSRFNLNTKSKICGTSYKSYNHIHYEF